MGYVIAFILVFRLRGSLLEAEDIKKWQSRLSKMLIGITILFIITRPIDEKYLLSLSGYVVLGCVIYLIYKNPIFYFAKPMMLSLLPIAIVFFVSDIVEQVNENFYERYDHWFGPAQGLSLVWLIAMTFIQNKQINTLRKQRNLIQQAELEKIADEAKKAELEKVVNIRTSELKLQNEKLTVALTELSATQQQLVHAEKMASLGELTAGIAHEIQNPLNFINNFAELNAELAAELKTAVEQGDTQDAIDLATDMAENSLKIAHHGKRADSIVKSMLQHSRGTTGQKESVNLNNLVDECLRLSFHGMKAKDKSFQAAYAMNFDENLPIAEVFSQDMGRVLLNLINNAFYAVSVKNQLGLKGYEPLVNVSTKQAGDFIEIAVEDNGNGIPQQIRDKIFQPFFTTKPTGQGTGLGLSLSYDIIKAHQGELKLESEEGQYTKFIIIIPLVKKG